ncbi:MAG TPA: gephyrin-like molybdotransferase Glp [Polyangiaceae bacterium]
MLTFDEARAKVLSHVTPLGHERVPLFRALFRVLAREVRAHSPFPPFAASAMDGYAVAISAFDGALPLTLPVVGESRTGGLAPKLSPRTACRIFTGAELPEGADAVVLQEDVKREGDQVTFASVPARGANIRRAGEDLAAGDRAIEAGTRLSPFQLSLAASLDVAELVVAARPRVTIVSTGDELRSPGEPAHKGSIPESNSIGLAALAESAGAVVSVAPLVGDDREATERAIADALARSDLLVTVGGVSVGDHDLVRPALERAGVTLDFWKVAIKPGKPLALGSAGRTHVLALPGNPASSLTTFSLFGMPLLRALQGDRRPLPLTTRLPLAADVSHKTGRLEFQRARLIEQEGRLTVSTLANQASGAVTSMGWAEALAMIPADLETLARGELVEVLRLADV